MLTDTVDDSSCRWWIILIKFHSVWRMNGVVCACLNFHFLNSGLNLLQAFYYSLSQGRLNSPPLGSGEICHRWRWWHSSQHKGEIKTGIWHRMPLKRFIRQLYFGRYPLGVSRGSPFGVRLSSDWASTKAHMGVSLIQPPHKKRHRNLQFTSWGHRTKRILHKSRTVWDNGETLIT